MNPLSHRQNITLKAKHRHQNSPEMEKIETAYDVKEVIFSEYSKVISKLLKDPVSLGIVGGNSNRGHQR